MATQSIQEQHQPTLPWVDFIRFVASFLVVLAHVQSWGNEPAWAPALFYTISRIGVPLFFLISGYLLLSKEEQTMVFFRKRASRILIPFFFWSIVYDVYNSESFAQTGVTLEAVLKMFIRILRGPRSGHLWFFYSLIGLYLFTPILRLYVSKARNSDLLYYIALWFIAMPLMYIVEEFTPIKNGFEIYYALGYVGYFLLGLYLGRMKTTSRLLWYGFGLFTLAFSFTLAVFILDLFHKSNELVFRSYPSLNVILMSLCAFVFIKAAGERLSARLARISNIVGRSSFGIYLIHPLVFFCMAYVWNASGFQTNTGNSLIVIPLVALINFLFCWGIVHVVRKIPFLRVIMG